MRPLCMALAIAAASALTIDLSSAQIVGRPIAENTPHAWASLQPPSAADSEIEFSLEIPEAIPTPPATNQEGLAEPIAENIAHGYPFHGDALDGCSCGYPFYAFGPNEPWRLSPYCCDGGINLGGWVQLGHHQFATPRSVSRGDLAAFNDVPRTYAFQQLWLFVEDKAQRHGCGWDVGYRLDIVYGTDAQKTQSFGNVAANQRSRGTFDARLDNGVYGWAVPQLYMEAVVDDVSIILGHFYSLVGYESVMAPENFFYSHSLTMFNSEPFTHTGILASYAAEPYLDVYAGLTFDWDSGFDQFRNGASFLGGFSLLLCDNVNVNWIITFGDFGLRGSSAYAQSIVVDAMLSPKLNYVMQSDLVAIGSSSSGGVFNDQVGINQYLFYHCNEELALGARLEWWKSDGISMNECTLGLNYKPHANVVIRPEIRFDWRGNLNRAGVIGADQSTLAVDAIFTY